MAEQLADETLRERGLDALERELGPALTLRFLASISRQTFDYQSWRDAHFGGLSLDEILKDLKRPAAGS
jgi:hypothetical protein